MSMDHRDFLKFGTSSCSGHEKAPDHISKYKVCMWPRPSYEIHHSISSKAMLLGMEPSLLGWRTLTQTPSSSVEPSAACRKPLLLPSPSLWVWLNITVRKPTTFSSSLLMLFMSISPIKFLPYQPILASTSQKTWTNILTECDLLNKNSLCKYKIVNH